MVRLLTTALATTGASHTARAPGTASLFNRLSFFLTRFLYRILYNSSLFYPTTRPVAYRDVFYHCYACCDSGSLPAVWTVHRSARLRLYWFAVWYRASHFRWRSCDTGRYQHHLCSRQSSSTGRGHVSQCDLCGHVRLVGSGYTVRQHVYQVLLWHLVGWVLRWPGGGLFHQQLSRRSQHTV